MSAYTSQKEEERIAYNALSEAIIQIDKAQYTLLKAGLPTMSNQLTNIQPEILNILRDLAKDIK